MAEAQGCVRAKGDNQCMSHHGQKLVMECKECQTLVCMECIAKEHYGHHFNMLKDTVQDKLQEIHEYINNVEKKDLPKAGQELQSTIQKLERNKEICSTVKEEIKNQHTKLKKELDDIYTRKLTEVDQIENKNAYALTMYRSQMEKTMDDMKTARDEAKKSIQSSNKVLVYDTATEIKTRSRISPDSPDIVVPDFCPCQDPKPLLESAFEEQKENHRSKGIVRQRKDNAFNQKHCEPASHLVIKNSNVKVPTNQPENTGARNAPTKSSWLQFEKTSELELTLFKSMHRICPVNEDTAWIHCTDLSEIYLYKSSGSVIKTLKTGEIQDICVNIARNQLYFCVHDSKKIMEIATENGKQSFLFTVNGCPWSIDVTPSNNILVGIYKEGLMYTTSGTILHRFTSGPLFPEQISASENYIAVVCGFDGTFILDNKLNVKFYYKGPTKQKGGSQKDEFCSTTAVFYTDNTRVLIGDEGNKAIHVVDCNTRETIQTLALDGRVETLGFYRQSKILWVKCVDPNKIVCFNLSSQ